MASGLEKIELTEPEIPSELLPFINRSLEIAVRHFQKAEKTFRETLRIYFLQGLVRGYLDAVSNRSKTSCEIEFDSGKCANFKDFVLFQAREIDDLVFDQWRESSFDEDLESLTNRFYGERLEAFADGFRQGYCSYGCPRAFRCLVAGDLLE